MQYILIAVLIILAICSSYYWGKKSLSEDVHDEIQRLKKNVIDLIDEKNALKTKLTLQEKISEFKTDLVAEDLKENCVLGLIEQVGYRHILKFGPDKYKIYMKGDRELGKGNYTNMPAQFTSLYPNGCTLEQLIEYVRTRNYVSLKQLP